MISPWKWAENLSKLGKGGGNTKIIQDKWGECHFFRWYICSRLLIWIHFSTLSVEPSKRNNVVNYQNSVNLRSVRKLVYVLSLAQSIFLWSEQKMFNMLQLINRAGEIPSFSLKLHLKMVNLFWARTQTIESKVS